MKINDQYPGKNIRPINRLVFKYQELTIKFSRLF
jgi:hypothetical protein